MLKRGSFALLVFAGIVFAITFAGSGASADSAPVPKNMDAWGAWWPKVQFNKNSTIAEKEIKELSREYESIWYGRAMTTWGSAIVSIEPLKDGDGFDFHMSWTSKYDPSKKKTKSPDKDDIVSTVVGPKDFILKSKDVRFGGSVCRGIEETTMMFSFGWLPADFEDYWVCVDFKDSRQWFLIPYGLGSKPAINGGIEGVQRDGPNRPDAANAKDIVHSWQNVQYKLPVKGSANRNFWVSFTNDETTTIELQLYKEGGRWTFLSQRTAVTYLSPEVQTRFGDLLSLTRDTLYQRTDHFELPILAGATSTWGAIRVSVEEESWDFSVPSSLTIHGHGSIDEE